MDIVQEGGGHGGVAALVAGLILRHNHLAADFAGAVGPCRRGSMDIHRVLSL